MKFNGNFTSPPTAPEIEIDPDENAAAIIATARRAARNDGWSAEDVQNITRELTSGDRDHFFNVLNHFFNVEEF